MFIDTSQVFRRRPRLARFPAIIWLSAILAVLPILSGLMFRTYWYHVEPTWYESLRQFDFPFFPAQLAVIFFAHSRGMTFRGLYELLDAPARKAALLFLGTFWLGSAFVSEQPLYSLLRCLYWLTHIGFGCSVFYLVRGPVSGHVKILGLSLSIGLLAYLPLLAIHFMLAPDPGSVRGGQIIWSSALPGFLSVRHLGIHAAAILVLLAATAVVHHDERGRFWLYSAALLSATLLFWSGTRAGILGFSAAGIVTWGMLRRPPPAKPALMIGLCLIAAIPLSMIWLPPEPVFGLLRMASSGITQVSENEVSGFSAGRVALWGQHLPLFLSSPLLGHGEGATFWLTQLNDTQHVQPHNSIIQFVIAWGLIPTMPIGYLALRCWMTIHREAAQRPETIPLVAMINCLLAMSLVDGAFYFTRMTMLIAVGVAIVLVSKRDSAISTI